MKSFGDKYYLNQEFNKAKVIQAIESYDEDLDTALLKIDLVKKHYAKQIGLTSSVRFLGESTDVVLDYPYKDTELKAVRQLLMKRQQVK